ncbi:hypothetical protein BJ912DRAFT_218928 [Pholiota molesta]|nr:hypothetical protein BJ912DRAFT_218928 [Pholiota molesta]
MTDMISLVVGMVGLHLTVDMEKVQDTVFHQDIHHHLLLVHLMIARASTQSPTTSSSIEAACGASTSSSTPCNAVVDASNDTGGEFLLPPPPPASYPGLQGHTAQSSSHTRLRMALLNPWCPTLQSCFGNLPPNILALLQSAQQQQRPPAPGQAYGMPPPPPHLMNTPPPGAMGAPAANPQYQQLMAYLQTQAATQAAAGKQ